MYTVPAILYVAMLRAFNASEPQSSEREPRWAGVSSLPGVKFPGFASGAPGHRGPASLMLAFSSFMHVCLLCCEYVVGTCNWDRSVIVSRGN